MLIFGKDIKLRKCSCSINCSKPNDVDPYVNLYIRVTNLCQATCPFCEFSSNSGLDSNGSFNPYFVKYILDELKSKSIRVNKVSFTGGEPSTYMDKVSKAAGLIKRFDKRIFITMNTNNIYRFDIDPDLIDSIAISKHEIGDTGFTCQDKEILDTLDNYGQDKVHLSCNIVKGYIDSPESVVNYLKYYTNLGVRDFGFVSLMKVNNYCENHFVDFNDLDFSEYKNIFRKSRNISRDGCECSNYLFKSGSLISQVYARHVLDGSKCNESMLVLDIDTLKEGFNGPEIIRE
jgi:MoaA/NifB/PqqE/SkfB family radical SAM enzyme